MSEDFVSKSHSTYLQFSRDIIKLKNLVNTESLRYPWYPFRLLFDKIKFRDIEFPPYK